MKAGSRSTLWRRLAQHRATSGGSGIHRGSIFRLLVGVALAQRQSIGLPPSWGVGGDPGAAARRSLQRLTSANRSDPVSRNGAAWILTARSIACRASDQLGIAEGRRVPIAFVTVHSHCPAQRSPPDCNRPGHPPGVDPRLVLIDIEHRRRIDGRFDGRLVAAPFTSLNV